MLQNGLQVNLQHRIAVKLHLRREWRNTDTSADEQHSFIVQEVLASAAEGPVDHNTGKHAVDRWRNDLTPDILLAAFLLLKVAADGLCKSTSEVTNNPNVDGDVVFLGCTEEVSMRT